MESISTLEASQKLKQLQLPFLNRNEVTKLFGVSNKNTTYKLLQRLEKKQILTRLKGGLYKVNDVELSLFAIANALVRPSYISLESALSHYGIVSQFPFTITSVTPQKSKKFNLQKREFEYSHIDLKLYWGFSKETDFLIANAEKALVDMVYFASQGLRRLDPDELDISAIDLRRFCRYVKKVDYAPFRSLITKTKLC